MANRKIVVALGGNAILSSDPTAQAQKQALVEKASLGRNCQALGKIN